MNTSKTIFLCFGMAAEFTALHLQLSAKQAWLAEHGVCFCGKPWNKLYGIHSHEELNNLMHANNTHDTEADYPQSVLNSNNSNACEERAMLFCFYGDGINHSLQAVDALLALPHFRSGWSVKSMLIQGRQDIVLEHLGRCCTSGPMRERYAKRFMRSAYIYADKMAETLAGRFGREALQLLPSPSLSAVLKPAGGDFLKAFCAWLDVPELPGTCMPENRLSLYSREMRHIYYVICKMGNDWPLINDTSLFTILADSEKMADFDERPEYSPEILAEAREKGAKLSRNLTRELSGHQLLFADTPAYCDTQGASRNGWEPYTGLTLRTAEKVVSLLAPEIAEALLARFDVDSQLLEEQGKTLYDALRNRCAVSPTARARLQCIARPGKVSVLVQTYNHEPYVAQALNSILEQNTTFPVDIIVVDDISTDGTRAIIDSFARENPRIKPVFLQAKSNKGENNWAMLNRAHTPYVALCDGDDYFTDPDKLQIQADYLDAHQTCALCFHRVKVVYEDGSHRERIFPSDDILPGGKRNIYSLEDLCQTNFIQTNSVMYRWRFADGMPSWFKYHLLPSDWYWHLLHAEAGSIGFIDSIMSAYRRVVTSLFYTSEQSSIVHRLKFGIKELSVYAEVNAHFKGKYAAYFTTLANGVFADLTRHYIETQDDVPLNAAVAACPQLADIYLKQLKEMLTNNRSVV